MKKAAPIFAIMLAVMLAPTVAFADASPWTEAGSSTDQILHKLDFGIKNLLGGWTEIIRVPLQANKDDGNVLEGIGTGLYNAAVYSIGGAIHTATFLFPQIDVPIPNDGVSFD